MSSLIRIVLATLVTASLPMLAFAQGKDKDDKAPTLPAPKAIPTPPIRLVLGQGEGAAKPTHLGCPGFEHTGGGNIIVAQPAPDTIVITMTGSALAKGVIGKHSLASWTIDLSQHFEVVYLAPVQGAKLTVEARCIGLLRSAPCCCSKSCAAAKFEGAHASVSCGAEPVVTIDLPARTASCGDDQTVYAREGPLCMPAVPGCYTLHQSFKISADVSKCPFLCKGVLADFAPESGIDPAWYGLFYPFTATATRDFGFRVTIRVVPE